MAVPADRSQLAALLQFSQECAVPYWIIGNGSNMLVSDQGLDGIAILLDSSFEGEIMQEGNLLIAPAGKHLSAVCAAACQAGLTGLEFAWGIPGSIGGAVYMNAGAYGGELKDRLVWVEYLNEGGQVQRLFTEQLGLSYRHSCFMEQPFLHGCILRAAFALEQGDRTAIAQEMERIITQRREKQPLEYPSAGSTFKRPQGAYASQLIDQCGLADGGRRSGQQKARGLCGQHRRRHLCRCARAGGTGEGLCKGKDRLCAGDGGQTAAVSRAAALIG